MKTYTYQFHAMKQDGNIIHNQDGIIIWKKPITDWEDYQENEASVGKQLPRAWPRPETNHRNQPQFPTHKEKIKWA